MSEELKPCPFCGGKCDPEGWLGGGGSNGLLEVRGPECEECGATSNTVEDWNRRAPTLPEPGAVPIPTSTDMARMMLALGHRYLKENAPEHLAEPAPASTGLSLIEYRASADDVWHSAPLSELESLVKDGFQVRAAPFAARELDVEAERREFEMQMANRGHTVTRYYDHGYADATLHRWEGWCAARSAAQGTAPAPADDSLALDDIEALRTALNWMGESTYETLEECGIYQRNLVRRLIHAVVANRDATLAAQASRPESAPVSTEQAGDASSELPPLYAQALDLAHEAGYASVSMVQRRLRIGWNAARDLIVLMHSRSEIPDAWLPPAALSCLPSPNNSPVGGKGEQ